MRGLWKLARVAICFRVGISGRTVRRPMKILCVRDVNVMCVSCVI
jgi:hypothetical protein